MKLIFTLILALSCWRATAQPYCEPSDYWCLVLQANNAAAARAALGFTSTNGSFNGMLSLNGLSATNQYFLIGTNGTNVNVVSSGTNHTFNFPTASATNRGVLSTADWIRFNTNGGVGSSSITTSNVLYVAKNGNDSTGTSNRLDLPFLTIGKAKTNAHAGDLIYVFPGVYEEKNLLTNGVAYYLSAYAFLTNSAGDIFSDNSNEVHSVIYGEGSFYALDYSILSVSNPLSKITFIGLDATNSAASGNNVFNIVACARVDIDVPTIDAGFSGNAVHFGYGELHVKSSYMFGDKLLDAVDPGTNSANAWISGDYNYGTINVVSPTNTYKAWVRGQQNYGVNTITMAGEAFLYVGTFKLKADALAVDIESGNPTLWLDVQKGESGGSMFYVTTGNVDAHIHDLKTGSIEVSGGTVKISGMTATNSAIVSFSGGELRLESCYLKNTNASPINLSADGLVLSRCTLVTDGVTNSVNALVPQTFINYFSVANAPTNITATTLVMPITVDAAVK